MMSETIEFELVRPVNPTGSSFIRYVWGQWVPEIGQCFRGIAASLQGLSRGLASP